MVPRYSSGILVYRGDVELWFSVLEGGADTLRLIPGDHWAYMTSDSTGWEPVSGSMVPKPLPVSGVQSQLGRWGFQPWRTHGGPEANVYVILVASDFCIYRLGTGLRVHSSHDTVLVPQPVEGILSWGFQSWSAEQIF